jgi:hypothetical protein
MPRITHAVLAVLSGNKTATEICREHQIEPDLFSKMQRKSLNVKRRSIRSKPGSPSRSGRWDA